MSLLLDTHILLWWLSDHQRLSDRLRKRIADSAAPVYVSLATIWEISIKVGAGKMAATPGGLRRLPHYIRESGFSLLHITPEHAIESGMLPWHHRDPFDRLLVAQATIENLSLVSVDPVLRKYAVSIVV